MTRPQPHMPDPPVPSSRFRRVLAKATRATATAWRFLLRYRVPQVLATLAVTAAILYFAWSIRKKDVDAIITCSSKDRYSTDVGTINFRQFSLGDVLIHGPGGAFQRIGSISIPKGDISETGIVDSGNFKFTNQLDFQFSAALDDATKARIESRVAGDLSLNLSKYSRHSIAVSTILPQLRAPEFVHFLEQDVHWGISNAREKIYVVSTVVFANSVRVGFARSSHSAGELGLGGFSVDGVHVNVLGQCLSDIQMSGVLVPAAFDVSAFLYEPGQGSRIRFNENEPYW